MKCGLQLALRAVSCLLLVLSILTPSAAFFVATRALPVHRGTDNLVYCARNPVATVVRTVQMVASAGDLTRACVGPQVMGGWGIYPSLISSVCVCVRVRLCVSCLYVHE